MKSSLLAPSANPRLPCLAFPELLSRGKLEAATACFARNACLLTPDATAIHDRQHIRPVLAQLIARHTQIEVELTNALVAGDVAFVRERWLVRADGVAGSQFEQAPCPELVLRRIEGQWKLAI